MINKIKKGWGRGWDILVIRKVRVCKVELDWKYDPRFGEEREGKDRTDTPCLRAAARASSSCVAVLADAGSGDTGTSLAGADSDTDMIESNEVKMIQQKKRKGKEKE